MKRMALRYTGKAKKMYETDDPDVLWVEYMDQATALNGKKKVHIDGKGAVNRRISAMLFAELTDAGVPTHYLSAPDETTMLVKKATMLPLEAVVRNYVSGSFERKFALTHLMPLTPAVHEFYFKSDALDDPFINDEQIIALKIADAATLKQVHALSDTVNTYLSRRFAAIGIKLVDFKLEFGRLSNGMLVLADELSPDNFRLVDEATGESLDKDVFRKNEGPLTPVYEEVFARLQKGVQHV
ncbi:phosphoribosylaminoimidazolesuccinocarboxamide synthase [Lacticaseibacillus mingshuiensis]|uniref:Phosphoribosylaminoimidazole-succinocarboxamide synthase n=1 Tax=Lacticaseibacillus mingshuiensis TaxID=2799574 RepID=A0ABW4CHH3_9LACO|nr:phosphoribosylaminoimidazolesuccinocarboxamide synthase [Lacticaseibacillus mingshuiensis]